jgi:transmembrane sensor
MAVDDLIIRVLKGEASPFEMERLKRWRSETGENEQYFQEIARVWELTAPEPTQSASGPPPVDAIIAASAPASRGRFGGRRSGLGRWGLLAASLAAVAIGIQGIGTMGADPTATYQAADQESLTVTLADGSVARLAPGSYLEEFEIQGRREVSLRGRAFFAVSRDETRPFIVRSGPGEVRVLGTRFEVSEVAEGGMRAVVVEGRVAVSNDEGSIEIGAGEMARMTAGSVPVASVPEDLYALLDWPDGILVFQGTRLTQVADEVSRHFQRPVEVVGEEFGDRRVTAWFEGESFEEVAESLCLVTNANCTPSGDGMTIGSALEAGRLQ